MISKATLVSSSRVGNSLWLNIEDATCVKYALLVSVVIFPDFKATCTSGRKFSGNGKGSGKGFSIGFLRLRLTAELVMTTSFAGISSITISSLHESFMAIKVEDNVSRLVCRNGLHKHDFWEIIKSKIRHSYEAHTYLRHIGFARWFQRIESLFGGNWANGPSVRDKCPCQFFPWQRTQHINVWRLVGGNMPTMTGLWLTVRVGHNVETKSRT